MQKPSRKEILGVPAAALLAYLLSGGLGFTSVESLANASTAALAFVSPLLGEGASMVFTNVISIEISSLVVEIVGPIVAIAAESNLLLALIGASTTFLMIDFVITKIQNTDA
ncbi:hypothetical protein [Halostagnicola kamekurae]|uniref:Uncharacterized protein n=1 Tax=Halostagnicola kamekurae TaxID=619731 RepID=A0A1I6RF78_9EURY|nr:hypothetical protein [Halostagnicola kamekurae]SFS63324.1 hypothetical protein SAMN04488556_1750 [Halostagnicola kamekurae]